MMQAILFHLLAGYPRVVLTVSVWSPYLQAALLGRILSRVIKSGNYFSPTFAEHSSGLQFQHFPDRNISDALLTEIPKHSSF